MNKKELKAKITELEAKVAQLQSNLLALALNPMYVYVNPPVVCGPPWLPTTPGINKTIFEYPLATTSTTLEMT